MKPRVAEQICFDTFTLPILCPGCKQYKPVSCKLYFARLVICLSVLLSLLISFRAIAQIPDNPVIDVLSADDGLSESITHTIMQDSKGFIWIAASAGLNRYDGNGFVVFRHNASDSFSISSGGVASLLEDKEGRLWATTWDKGLNYIDRVHQRFYHFMGDSGLINMVEDKNGIIYINNINRLFCLVVKPSPSGYKGGLPFTVTVYPFLFVPHYDGKKSSWGSRLFSDNKKNVFATQIDGLYAVHFDTATKQLHTEKLFSFDSTHFPPSFCQDVSTGKYYLSTPAGIFESSNNRFTQPGKIHAPLENSAIMFVDRKSRLWYADHFGNHTYNLLTGEDTKVVVPPGNPKLESGNLRPSMVDNNNTIWMQDVFTGVAKYSDDNNTIRTLMQGTYINHVTNINDSDLWVNLDHIIHFGKKGISVKPVMDRNKTGFPYVADVIKDGKGNFWYWWWDSLLVQKNPATGFSRRIPIPWDRFPPNHRYAWIPESIYADREGCIWLCCYSGLFFYYDTHNGKFHSYIGAKSNLIKYEDAEGMMWMQIEGGVGTFNRTTGQTKLIYFTPGKPRSLPSEKATGFCDDPLQPHRYIWIGTNNGLCRMEKKTGLCRTFTTKDGLPDNMIFNLLEDNNGDLWFNTNGGLTQLHPADLSFRNFDVSDGLPSREFNGNTSTKLKDGTLIFAGVKGLIYFNPKDIKPLPPPRAVLTDFRVFGKSANGDSAISSGTYLPYTKEVFVSYNDNIITFTFAGVDYRKMHALHYRYKLLPFDKGWNYSGTSHDATYTNLNPGTYTFIAEASNTSGVWGKESEALTVQVLPLWWQTWWFRVLVVIGVVSLLFLLYRYRLQQVLQLERVRNNIARDLHDEIGSTLSTISIYSTIAQQQSNRPEANPFLLMRKINENTSKVMEAMSDIVWSINTKNDKFENIISRMQEHAIHLLEVKGYTVHFNFDEHLDQKSFGLEKRKNFYLIYKEALNNIMKYAEGSNVWIQITGAKSSLILSVKDDGKGFDMTSLKQRGNGLSNMQSRAAGVGGEIVITSAVGQGTEIRIEIPYR